MRRKRIVDSINKGFLTSIMVLCIASCGSSQKTSGVEQDDNQAASIPEFSGDSAYTYTERQCGFGPRVLGSEAHEKCGQYIMSEFRRFGCRTFAQNAEFVRYDGKSFKGYNIIAQTNPSAAYRIVICAHWDSRPWADQDSDPAKRHLPVMAANDGASGVGVMIELARLLQKDTVAYGVDFICFDAEDMGTPAWEKSDGDDSDTWCLGSQHWAKNPHSTSISYGILLDMVGGTGSSFYQEGFSSRYAQSIVKKVWDAAAQAGYGEYFPTSQGGYITDDHLPMNRIAHIPTIDIVNYYPTYENGFGPTWHTSHDTMNNISVETLKAVGQTVVQLLYTENHDN